MPLAFVLELNLITNGLVPDRLFYATVVYPNHDIDCNSEGTSYSLVDLVLDLDLEWERMFAQCLFSVSAPSINIPRPDFNPFIETLADMT